MSWSAAPAVETVVTLLSAYLGDGVYVVRRVRDGQYVGVYIRDVGFLS